MWSFIKDNWFQLIFLILLIPAYKGIASAIENAISKIPEQIHNKNMILLEKEQDLSLQKDEQYHNKNLQIDNYFRSISGKNIENLFSSWTDTITDAKKIGNLKSEQINKMLKELIMYGSEKTVKIASVFMQYSFQGEEMKKSNENYTQELVYIGAKLVSSLKNDFTGYDVDPIFFLQIKINDFYAEKNKPAFEQAKEKIDLLLLNI